MSFNH